MDKFIALKMLKKIVVCLCIITIVMFCTWCIKAKPQVFTTEDEYKRRVKETCVRIKKKVNGKFRTLDKAKDYEDIDRLDWEICVGTEFLKGLIEVNDWRAADYLELT